MAVTTMRPSYQVLSVHPYGHRGVPVRGHRADRADGERGAPADPLGAAVDEPIDAAGHPEACDVEERAAHRRAAVGSQLHHPEVDWPRRAAQDSLQGGSDVVLDAEGFPEIAPRSCRNEREIRPASGAPSSST